MKRLFAALLALLIFIGLSAAAEEDAPAVATLTDLECAHEHTKEVCYFDSPVYTALNGTFHRVYGPGLVETVCEDCGEVLSSEYKADAEQIRYHTFRKGKCALCGEPKPAEPDPSRETVFVPAAAEGDSFLRLTVTEAELSVLEKENIGTLLVRPDGASAAAALPVYALRSELAEAGATLEIAMQLREDGSVQVILTLQSENGTAAPRAEGAAVRMYRDGAESLKAAFLAADGESPVSAEAVRREDGWWEIPWQGNGTYSVE